jgi:hypothetical protein
LAPRNVSAEVLDGAAAPDPKQRWLTFVRNHCKVVAGRKKPLTSEKAVAKVRQKKS